MSERTFLLVVYDISNDRRRTKLHNLLLDYGTPVQYSVFEMRLKKNEIAKMKRAVMKVIKPKKDQVRFYSLCANCVAKIEITSGKEVVGEPPSAIIVG